MRLSKDIIKLDPLIWWGPRMYEATMQVKKCPKCNTLFKAHLGAEMNFDDSMTWTDGQVIGPKFVKDEAILCCPSCKSSYWLKDIETVDEFDDDLDFLAEAEGKGRYWKTPLGFRPQVQDLLKLLNLGIPDKEDELYVRVSLLHLLNDQRRDGFGPELGEIERSNLEMLAKIIEPKSIGRIILLGEVYRELGRFDDAERLMAMACPRNDNWVMYIGYLASIHDRKVRAYSDVPKEYAFKVAFEIHCIGNA